MISYGTPNDVLRNRCWETPIYTIWNRDHWGSLQELELCAIFVTRF